MYTRVRAYNTRTDQVGYWYLDGRRRKTIIFLFFVIQLYTRIIFW